MFWAGDTAQTISAGSSFRFGELKAFMFHLEVWQQNETITARLTISALLEGGEHSQPRILPPESQLPISLRHRTGCTDRH